MAELGCYSPSFKKPCDVLRMRRNRARSEGPERRTSSPVASVPGVRPFSPGPLLNAPGRSQGGVKRRNPFANIENTYNSPKKRALSQTDGEKAAVVPVLDGKLKERPNAGASRREELLNTDRRKQHEITIIPLSEDDCVFEEERSTPVLKSPESVCPAAPAEVCVEFPADWSLKTRVLFTSPQSFSWAEHVKAQEEAQGLSAHCRAQFTSAPAHIPDPRGCVELRCGFQQCLQFWQHPSMPWLSLFPRIGAERKFSGKCVPWAQDSALQQSLMSDCLLKARLCPYFYLCSYQFTVLFRAAGLSGSKGITALLSPTTRGLREAMRADGIEFSLPLLEERRKSKDLGESAHQTDSAVLSEHSENEEDDDDDDDDDGGFSWLKEMGVQDKIKKPDSISIKLRKEHREVCLDHRPESVVLVEGSNTFTLINFLINCKSLVAGASSQAGLPPTLLAPTAFRGATLHTLKARAVNVKTLVRTGYQDVCSLEVTGPIMPHTLHALTQLLRPAQRGEFSVGLYTHEPTAVLNVPISQSSEPETQPECVVQDLGVCGLQQSSVQQLAAPSILGKCALRQLHMRDYSYSWKT
ncbi:protein downstream neighbor of son homolog isoform X4 [Rhinichthys klamathensis goyatoka]|uniref:protein downstream neighbor of son homolog isoform X4 n=1 Tax=Rhinichthys klamathensis goyatoka TaxID=3034132 RepID=UPI0024B54547|nr:protein downstream neighbor of son homolog isoform X4 [Rhinichthys klamathensis goyatoka]